MPLFSGWLIAAFIWQDVVRVVSDSLCLSHQSRWFRLLQAARCSCAGVFGWKRRWKQALTFVLMVLVCVWWWRRESWLSVSWAVLGLRGLCQVLVRKCNPQHHNNTRQERTTVKLSQRQLFNFLSGWLRGKQASTFQDCTLACIWLAIMGPRWVT